MTQPSATDDDFRFAERCLAGESDAVGKLRELCSQWVRAYLVRSGATVTESGALAETLVADCLVATNGKQPLLASYLGLCPLRAWLCRLALNRLLTSKREFQRERAHLGDRLAEHAVANIPDRASELAEEPVLRLVREAIIHAFAECEAEHFVILQLHDADGLKVEEIARMFGCSIATVSRNAERARTAMRAAIMKHLRARDPWLELTFDDLLAICRTVLPDCFGME